MQLPVGPLVDAGPAVTPSPTTLSGRYTTLKPLHPSHAPALFKHLGGEHNFHRWTYMFTAGWNTLEECQDQIAQWSQSKDPLYLTVFSGSNSDAASEPVGLVAYLSIVPSHRRIEIGCIIFGEQLKQTRTATEAFHLVIKHAFEDLGNYRVEWKANHLNKPSLSAAQRLGFVSEGVFRKHMIVKGRRRDTAWFSITDEEWPIVKKGLEAWLDESNFDAQGKQIKGLREWRESLT